MNSMINRDIDSKILQDFLVNGLIRLCVINANKQAKTKRMWRVIIELINVAIITRINLLNIMTPSQQKPPSSFNLYGCHVLCISYHQHYATSCLFYVLHTRQWILARVAKERWEKTQRLQFEFFSLLARLVQWKPLQTWAGHRRRWMQWPRTASPGNNAHCHL